MENFGERFLHRKNAELNQNEYVEHAHAQTEDVPNKPAQRIAHWLEVIKQTHEGHADDPRVLERIKNFYQQEHVIKPENIGDEVYQLEQRIQREQGHGEVEITEEFKQQKQEQIINDQTQSLDRWLVYLTSEDANYPMWAKYWAFTSLVKMGGFEKSEDKDGNETGRFKARTSDTVAPFPVLNQRALANAIGVLAQKLQEKEKPKAERERMENISVKLDDPEFQQLVAGESFSQLYAQFLIEQPEYSAEGLKETRGEWVTYPQGSTPDELVASLDGYPLEWCTANSDTARSQLQAGDFHVYYSLNTKGEPVIPRLAIRMNGTEQIGEVRGIAANQNLDPYIGEVLSTKLATYGAEGEAYEKKSTDMKRVTELEETTKAGRPLGIDDLKFLYELDGSIKGFGYQKDPRIAEMLKDRDIKEDLSFVLNVPKEKISTTKEEALSGDIVYHHGDLNLNSLTSAEGLTLPQTVGGGLDLRNLTNAEGLTLPQTVGGSLYLSSLTNAEKQKIIIQYPHLSII